MLKMSLVRSIALGIGLMVAACTASDPVGPWDGEYSYGTAGGHTAGGSPVTMELTLTIKKSGADETCLLNVAGFQTDERMVCTLTDKGNKLEIRFKSYDDKSLLKIPYEVGGVLFSLEKAEGKDKKIRYVPHWAAYVPFEKDSGIANEANEGDFEKTK